MSDTRAVHAADPETALEQQAFELFFAESWPWAYKLATFLVHDQAVGEEIAQEALTMMYRTWGTAERPEAYLRAALVNAAKNWYRRSSVRHDKLPLLAEPVSVEFSFSELSDAVAHLPFRQRAVIVLRYHGGLSEAEIAEALDCRPGTVKSLASRALEQLSKEITR